MNTGEQPGQGPTPNAHLRPPGAAPAPEHASSKQVFVWAALAVVILLGLGVLFILPGMVADGVNSAPPVPAAEVTLSQAEEAPAESTVTRTEATQALQEYLMVQARLELANAPVWGDPEWSQAVTQAGKGNDHFGKRAFAAARTEFEQARDGLLQLESETGQRLATALASGQQALENDQSEAAGDYFKLAIAIDAANEEAAIGLERAQARPSVLKLMGDGGYALAQGKLTAAQTAYAEATRLDGLYAPAQTALEDITARITDQQFNAAMSEALKAIANEQVKQAGDALLQAENLKPGQQAVADSRYRLDQLKRRLWLAAQRQAGQDNETQEKWGAAVAVYQQVLKNEPQAGFATQGLARAEDRARLHQQLDHYLDDPARVYSSQPRANAEKLLAAAGRAPAGEAVLADKLQRLSRLVEQAKQPVTVTLQSDGETRVAVYHVGRLGAFTSHQLELTPGSYTVVGSRPGYRDVRKTLVIKPGETDVNLLVQCEDAI